MYGSSRLAQILLESGIKTNSIDISSRGRCQHISALINGVALYAQIYKGFYFTGGVNVRK